MGEADWRTVFSAGPGRAHLGLLRLSGSGKEIDLWGVTLCAAGRGCWRSPLLQMRQNGLDHRFTPTPIRQPPRPACDLPASPIDLYHSAITRRYPNAFHTAGNTGKDPLFSLFAVADVRSMRRKMIGEAIQVAKLTSTMLAKTSDGTMRSSICRHS